MSQKRISPLDILSITVERIWNGILDIWTERIPPEEIFQREEQQLTDTIYEGKKSESDLLDMQGDFEAQIRDRSKVLAEMEEASKKSAKRIKATQDPMQREALTAEFTKEMAAMVAEEQSLEMLQLQLMSMQERILQIRTKIQIAESNLKQKRFGNRMAESTDALTDILNKTNDMLEQVQGETTSTASVMADKARAQIQKRHEKALSRNRHVERQQYRDGQDLREAASLRVQELVEEALGETTVNTTSSGSIMQEEVAKTKTAQGG